MKGGRGGTTTRRRERKGSAGGIDREVRGQGESGEDVEERKVQEETHREPFVRRV